MRPLIPLSVFCAVIALAISWFILTHENPPSALVPEIQAPKQSHHVVYFWVCDDFIGALLTTKPTVWLDANDGVPSKENVVLMQSAFNADRVAIVRHQHRGCSLKPLPKKSEST